MSSILRNILTTIFILSSFTLEASEWKSFDKELVLKSGPKAQCPQGRAYALVKKNVFLLGQNHSFSLEKTSAPVEESVDEGCTYKTESLVLENKLVEKTLRSKCPNAKENGSLEESIELKNNNIIYKNIFINEASKRSEFECLYQ